MMGKNPTGPAGIAARPTNNAAARAPVVTVSQAGTSANLLPAKASASLGLRRQSQRLDVFNRVHALASNGATWWRAGVG